MRKLITLLLGIKLISSVAASDFEIDPFKYIPEDTEIMVYDLNIDGTPDLFWWDKNKDNMIEPYTELFFDLNGDYIPDMNFTEFIEYFKPNPLIEFKQGELSA